MISEFINSETFEVSAVIIFKIIVCVILVGAIGYNREKKGMVVGIRTHVMVGLVGLLIQITSLEYYRINGGDNDVFRLAGQYISGIGFLGARPIIATKHIDAAVVKPFMLLLSFNIVPAPKKPIPEIYCPANLNTSLSPPLIR